MQVLRKSSRCFGRLLFAPVLLMGAAACESTVGGSEDENDSFGAESSKQGISKEDAAQSDNKLSEKESDESPVDSPDTESVSAELPDSNQPVEEVDTPEPEGTTCEDVKHQPCDAGSDDPLHAIGINCPGETPQVKASFRGADRARGIRSKFGTTEAFDPREGEKYLVLGTGDLSKIDTPESGSGALNGPSASKGPVCNADLGKEFDLSTLPAPMNTTGVGSKTCAEDPSLVGKGDCSNSIGLQWLAAPIGGGQIGAFDYNELRIKATVPEWAHSLSFDFSFMTVEYPEFFGKAYNDFFVVWLESKKWTGNISFDKNGRPISLNAGFFDYKDSSNPVLLDPACIIGCDAKELHDTCLAEHASTKWLTTTVGVTPGEEIELIFAIVDLGDSSLDSFAFIDNFHWGCKEQPKPETDPPPI